LRNGFRSYRHHNQKAESTSASRETLTVTDNRTGRSYEVPITHGTIRASDLRQIKVDPKEFGMMSYDPAFNNTASCISRITYIDGDAGILRYRGYPIEDLAEKSTYLETRTCWSMVNCPPRSIEGLDLQRHAPHLHSREHQEISGRLSLRCSPNGHADFDHRGAFDFLPRRQGHLQRGITPKANLPAHWKDADDSRVFVPHSLGMPLSIRTTS